MSDNSNYNLLIASLDQFIRKYYVNKIVRGVLLCITLCVAMFLMYSVLESQLYFSKGFRKFLFYSYLISLFISVGSWIVIPLLKLLSFGPRISHEDAAEIIGNHFENVKDKLLNILQLQKHNTEVSQRDLIEASINQKANAIKLVPFKTAIDLGKNRRYLRYALPPIALAMFLLFAAPSLLTDSTYRIINNNKDFERPAPYHFVLSNSDLTVVQYEDFKLEVSVEGEKLPNEAFIRVDNYEYRLSKDGPDKFSYLFSNVRKETEFEIFSGKQRSGIKKLGILAKPKMINFQLAVRYPAYTGRKRESLNNITELAIPEGSALNWKFETRSTDEILLHNATGEKRTIEKSGTSDFTLEQKLFRDSEYKLVLLNKENVFGDSLHFYLRTIKDQFPQISVEMVRDSLDENIYYVVGSVSDDYGVTKLTFNHEIRAVESADIHAGAEQILIPVGLQSEFRHIVDVRQFKLTAGDRLDFFYEVFDNDQVNGVKSSKSNITSHQKKTFDQLKKEEEHNEEEIKDKLKNSRQELLKIQEELNKLREKLLQKQEPDWQDKKQLQKLLDRQKELQKQMDEAKNALDQNLKNQQELMTMSPEMIEKQERIQELFNEMVNDEMKDLMEKIQELMNDLGKEQTLQMMEEFKMKEENMEQEMERLEELYKQLEVEKELNESINELNELAEQLNELSEKTESGQQKQEELQTEQKEINEDFEKLTDKMKEMMKKNEELEFPKSLSNDLPEQLEDTNKDLEKSEQQLNQNQNNKASQSQKSASEKMKKMASGMQQQMMSGEAQQMEEDIKTLRQLLENLVGISFEQENLVNDVNRAIINTPRYISLLQKQLKLKDDFKLVQDTLEALSKRQAQLESFILEKVTEVKSNLNSSLVQLEERMKPEANQSQRSSMKNLNDLALMLSEAMEQMQQQMANMMSGTQMCQNPGQSPGQKQGQQGNSGNVPMDKISEGQEEMSDELKQMMEKMQNGKSNSSKDFAQAAARQAALRKALEELSKQQQENGQGSSDLLQQIIEQMDKQEIDLVNKRLDNEMLSRQQDILTRLLEAENAQKEREWDDKRESQSGKDQKKQFPPELEQYLKERKAILDQYKYVSPDLSPYYKSLVDEYYKKLKRA